MSITKIFITGAPRVGKSTLLTKLLANIEQKQGFVTNEILEDGERTGFRIVTAGGMEAILASVHLDSPLKVARYSVSVDNLNKIIPELQNFSPEDILYIDEIGEMELYSEEFKKLVEKYLDANNIFVCTINKIFSDDFTEKILARNDIKVFDITPENRDEIYQELVESLEFIDK